MATQLRPNWVPADNVGNVDAPFTMWAGVAQPEPSSDQSATVIRAWGYITSGVDVSAETIDFVLFDGYLNGSNAVNAGARQIGDTITVGMPAVADDDDAINQPFFLQWIDIAQSQSGMYAICYDPTLGADIVVSEFPQTVIYPIAP